MWCKESNRNFGRIQKCAYGENNERSFSNPHPWWQRITGCQDVCKYSDDITLVTLTHVARTCRVNTLRPRQNERHFADDIFKCIFLNENIWISIKISLKFVPKGSINNIPALVQIMAWRRPGDKPLSEGMMVNLPTHICVSRPQWVNRDICQMLLCCQNTGFMPVANHQQH